MDHDIDFNDVTPLDYREMTLLAHQRFDSLNNLIEVADNAATTSFDSDDYPILERNVCVTLSNLIAAKSLIESLITEVASKYKIERDFG